MKDRYDIIVIGLGPAGMAVANMGPRMGLKVLAVENREVGGECSNVGCIPSKALLKISEKAPLEGEPFTKINRDVVFIRENKNLKMVQQAELLLGKGPASFTDDRTVRVDGVDYTAKRIFIAVGTRPLVPPIEGLKDLDYLTNENLFQLKQVPPSMTIIGGGAVGCEMAWAFSRLGCRCSIVQDRHYLVPNGEEEAGEILKKNFEDHGIAVHNGERITKVYKDGGEIALETESGIKLVSDKLLVAAGRRFDFSSLKLENAGVEYGKKGIIVDDYLRTNKKHIYAVGDCNGAFLLSHAAMHQGMLGVVNTIAPGPFKKKYKDYFVPWTVFTEPEISHVGKTAAELDREGVEYETYESRYGDYGAAIAEDLATGYVRAYVSDERVLGVGIVGAGSGEMINEWAVIMQNKVSLFSLMTTMHSFPTMGFMSKGIAEKWAMQKLAKNDKLKKLIKFLFG